MRPGDDGMWRLDAKLDFLTGRHVNTALQAMVRSLRRRAENTDGTADDGNGTAAGQCDANDGTEVGGAGVVPTRAQLTADAISDLIAGTAKVRRANTSLVIIADYDVVNDRLANPRLDDGTLLSARMLAEHGVDAKVLPAMFKADWSDVALGRARNASDAQRLILAVRDRGCIGCELTCEHTQAHHIDYYEHGGLTEIPNLASMCWDMPSQTSTQHDRQIHTPPDGRPLPAARPSKTTPAPDRLPEIPQHQPPPAARSSTQADTGPAPARLPPPPAAQDHTPGRRSPGSPGRASATAREAFKKRFGATAG